MALHWQKNNNNNKRAIQEEDDGEDGNASSRRTKTSTAEHRQKQTDNRPMFLSTCTICIIMGVDVVSLEYLITIERKKKKGGKNSDYTKTTCALHAVSLKVRNNFRKNPSKNKTKQKKKMEKFCERKSLVVLSLVTSPPNLVHAPYQICYCSNGNVHYTKKNRHAECEHGWGQR